MTNKNENNNGENVAAKFIKMLDGSDSDGNEIGLEETKIIKEGEQEQVIIEEYKGHPILKFVMGRFFFSFGLSKAKVILENIEKIKMFVSSNGKSIK